MQTVLSPNDLSFGREMFSSPDNQAIVVKLVENSLGLLPNTTAAMLGKQTISSSTSVCTSLY